VLQQVGERLLYCLLTEDIVARSTTGAAIEENIEASRFGGDEFTVLVGNLKAPSFAGLIAERIRSGISAPYLFEGTHYSVACSIGIATYPEDGDDPLKLIQCADGAMYTAKQSGKNQHRYYDPVISAQAGDQLRMRTDLSRAIEEEQLHLHYQPIYDLRTNQMIGCEALLRWSHGGQSISPAVFIPLAEDAGLMKDIGHWVLEAACRQQRDWQEQGIDPLTISINVSAHQFSRANFRRQVEESLHKYGVHPETLRIEITETSMMKESAEVTKALGEICILGVAISLDDFGTGYSSLAMLKALPIDNVKIDKIFIDELARSREGKAIVKAVIAMCKELGLSVTAEGVELEEQLSLLQELECDYIQGYLKNRPLTVEKMTALISADTAVSA
jgi:diguanylate cyclase (GGDEF)-like protein